MRRFPLAVSTAAAAIGALVLTACSGSTVGSGVPQFPAGDSSGGTSVGTSHSTVPSPYPKASTAPTSSSVRTTTSAADAQVGALLLTAGEVGKGFLPAEDDPPSPLPCTPDRPAVDDQVRHVAKAGAVYVDDMAGLQFSEHIYVYRSVGDALRHQRAVERGLACRTGSLPSGPVSIEGPVDLGAELAPRHDVAEAWSVRTAQVTGSLIAVRIHAVVVQFAFLARPDVTPTIDAKQVVVAGLKKLLAAA